MNDRIAKQKLNVILLVDCSTSMRGERISQVNKALREIKNHLVDMEKKNTNVDFYLTVITFSTEARYLNDDKMTKVDEFDFIDISAGGWSNLHCAYHKLDEILLKESKGGIMPDFGGVAPILLLLTDGHPTGDAYRNELINLQTRSWFKFSLRYGIAIELKDKRTMAVLEEFVGNNGDVIDCFDSMKLEKIIKIIVLTASKVKSSSANVLQTGKEQLTETEMVQQEVKQALNEVDDWEW